MARRPGSAYSYFREKHRYYRIIQLLGRPMQSTITQSSFGVDLGAFLPSALRRLPSPKRGHHHVDEVTSMARMSTLSNSTLLFKALLCSDPIAFNENGGRFCMCDCTTTSPSNPRETSLHSPVCAAVSTAKEPVPASRPGVGHHQLRKEMVIAELGKYVVGNDTQGQENVLIHPRSPRNSSHLVLH